MARITSGEIIEPRLFSALGETLLYICWNPDCTVRQISAALCLTSRTTWGTIGQLRQAKLIKVRKEGRRHHYKVDYIAQIKLFNQQMSLSDLFKNLARIVSDSYMFRPPVP